MAKTTEKVRIAYDLVRDKRTGHHYMRVRGIAITPGPDACRLAITCGDETCRARVVIPIQGNLAGPLPIAWGYEVLRDSRKMMTWCPEHKESARCR